MSSKTAKPIIKAPRIKFTIGSKQKCSSTRITPSGQPGVANGLAFDKEQGLLFVADSCNDRVQVFSSDDGSFVTKFGSFGTDKGQFLQPRGIAIDHEHERILVSDTNNHRVQVWSLRTYSHLLSVGKHGSRERQFHHPRGIAIDYRRQRVIVVDAGNNRLQFLSLKDLSFLFAVGSYGFMPDLWDLPTTIAIDEVRDRLIVTDTRNNRLQILSADDGSLLFVRSNEDGWDRYFFSLDGGLCVDQHGNILAVDCQAVRAFTPEGRCISVLRPFETQPLGLAFDDRRDLLAISFGTQVLVLNARAWLPSRFVWAPDRHCHAPKRVRNVVVTMTMIRSLAISPVSLLPNELLFLIFELL